MPTATMRWLLPLVATHAALGLRVGTQSAPVAPRAAPPVCYGKLPQEALVPRGKVSMNPFENLKQMSDQRVAGVSHILLAPGKCTLPLDEAKALMATWKTEIADDTEKFKDKAKVESHCPTAANGGDLGFVVRSTCAESFNKILFDEEPGRVYGPIVTTAGLHLIFLHSCREPKSRPDLPFAKKD